MNDLISKQDAIDAHCELCEDRGRCNCDICPDVEVFQLLPSAQPEEKVLTEEDYAYCLECNHVEMCKWHPTYGCEFKDRPSAHPEIIRCKDCKHRYTDECPMQYTEWVERDEYGEYELRDIVHDYTEDEKFCSEGEREE